MRVGRGSQPTLSFETWTLQFQSKGQHADRSLVDGLPQFGGVQLDKHHTGFPCPLRWFSSSRGCTQRWCGSQSCETPKRASIPRAFRAQPPMSIGCVGREVGRRWFDKTRTLIQSLVRFKAHSEPLLLRNLETPAVVLALLCGRPGVCLFLGRFLGT